MEIPTVTGQLSENNAALDFIESYLRERGMHIYRTDFDGYGAIVATTRPTKTPRVMLAGHIDVVPASPNMFRVREDGNKLIGRGVWDMKSAIAGYLLAVDSLKDNLADYDFGIMITSDEETRDLGMKALIDEGYCPTEAAVLFDGGYDWQVARLAKGAFYGIIEIAGETGHGSRTWLVDSASMRLVSFLAELQTHFDKPAIDVNTLNISLIQAGAAGKAVNQIPATAQAGVDIRVMSETDAANLKKVINNLCDKYGATFTPFVEFTALNHDMKSPHMASFIRHIKDTTGIENEGVISAGASDANHFMAQGIECVVTWPIGGGHHSEQEWIDKQALEDIVPIISGYLQEMTKVKTLSLVEPQAYTR